MKLRKVSGCKNGTCPAVYVSDYQRYQFDWIIPDNMEAGEEIRVLDLTDDDFGLPNQDFWLFDEKTVVHLNFNPDGTLINIERPDDIDVSEYLRWRDIALRNSVPFAQYGR